MEELEKVAGEVDKKLVDGNRDAALSELARLAESLGLSLEMPGETDG